MKNRATTQLYKKWDTYEYQNLSHIRVPTKTTVEHVLLAEFKTSCDVHLSGGIKHIWSFASLYLYFHYESDIMFGEQKHSQYPPLQ